MISHLKGYLWSIPEHEIYTLPFNKILCQIQFNCPCLKPAIQLLTWPSWHLKWLLNRSQSTLLKFLLLTVIYNQTCDRSRYQLVISTNGAWTSNTTRNRFWKLSEQPNLMDLLSSSHQNSACVVIRASMLFSNMTLKSTPGMYYTTFWIILIAKTSLWMSGCRSGLPHVYTIAA